MKEKKRESPCYGAERKDKSITFLLGFFSTDGAV